MDVQGMIQVNLVKLNKENVFNKFINVVIDACHNQILSYSINSIFSK
jgi:hypothetical protein